ncbi:MAG: Rho-binding antiterminator [Candidatus Phlomobacter fragariae]
MSKDTEYKPINCDDYDNLELTCQHSLLLTIKLNNGEIIVGKAIDLLLKKQVEYLVIDVTNEKKQLRLDHIVSFSHPEIGDIVIDHSGS